MQGSQAVVIDTKHILHLLRIAACAASALLAGCYPQAQPSPETLNASPQTLPLGTRVSRNPTTHAIERAEGAFGDEMHSSGDYRAFEERSDYAGMAMAFLGRYRSEFRLQSPLEDLHVVRVNADRLGYHQVRLGQTYRDLPVLDAELIVHFDPNDKLYLVQGHYLPTPSDIPEVPPIQIGEARGALVAELDPEFEVATGELVVLLPDESARARLAYRFEARRGLVERREVLVDATTGSTVRYVPTVLNAR